MEYKIAVISGDGIGPEIVREARKVLDRVGAVYGHKFQYEEVLMGGISIDTYGVPLTKEALETARSFFPSVCTTHAYDEDLATLAIARSAGLEVCSCGIFGLGESWAQRVELLQTLREVGVDSLPVNFLCPVPGTPLGSRSPLAPWEALRVVALARLMHPEQEIIICGGRLSTLKDAQALVLTAGASALMSGNYLTTRGFGYADDDALLAAVGTLRR